ncbi:hypothetical protein [Gymnodinialimonas ulvae]|uniref:hypothetical protein n=1 Tax=Gymnodinialimonas ulvae TaxID=3126504 RepID=UPI0030A3429D
MTPLARLRDTLNATAMIGEPAHAAPPVTALTNAINRTILPRRMEARLQDGVHLTFYLRNRRLHRMEKNAPSAPPWNLALGPEDCDAVADALKTTCPAGTFAAFQTTGAQTADPFDSLGIAASALIERLAPAPAQVASDDFQTRIAAVADSAPTEVEASFAMAGDEIAPLTGSEAAIDALLPEITDLFLEITDQAFSLAGALETDGTLVLPRAGASAGCHLIVGHVGMIGLLVLRDMSPGAALALWARTQT